MPCREPGAQRVFPYQLIDQKNMTVQGCLTQCAAFGYPAAGLEYGQECCASDLSVHASLANDQAR